MRMLEKHAGGLGHHAGRSSDKFIQELSDRLDRSGQWQRWAAAIPALRWPGSLSAACEQWRDVNDIDAYQVVAALCRLGSRRGADEPDAALAVVAVLGRGIEKVAAQVDDVCTIGDVRAAVWEEVRRSEPNLGRKAPSFILKRAKQRLLRPASGLLDRRSWSHVSLEHLRTEPGEELAAATVTSEDSVDELTQLLDWARAAGVLEESAATLLLDLVNVASSGRVTRAVASVSERRGVSPRTIRRQRAEAIEALRAAVPVYLSETA